jgi:hypothetical protein
VSTTSIGRGNLHLLPGKGRIDLTVMISVLQAPVPFRLEVPENSEMLLTALRHGVGCLLCAAHTAASRSQYVVVEPFNPYAIGMLLQLQQPS